VDAEKIDLLAMSTRKRSFLDSFIDKSLTQTAAFHTTIPLLAFHDKEKV
jgi:nucleotide-binding universal stress UspA family protein